MDNIILVDEKDNQIGVGEKLKVHREGKLHRAFSVLIFNSKGETLLQKRAAGKYHCPGLWTNTCCSHPRASYDIREEAERRLKEEMGIDPHLKEIFSFIYKADLGELTEHEFDHVFVGQFEGDPSPDPEEADGWKWISVEDLKEDVRESPEIYTPWFRVIMGKISLPLDF
ncbi:MAG: isopentenyl-diphosphate Delta-isomerase [bacterium]|nr:isopentenyl-diphosphate Delta-isomerase [bacterium]